MPQLPIGQKKVPKWPVLDLGRQPKIAIQEWRLVVDGACQLPLTLTWEQFLELPQVEETSDFHCVTAWSKLDMRWQGVRFADLAALVGVTESATHVLCHGYDGYTTNLPLEEALKTDVMLVYAADGEKLSRAHGGPVRMITPQLYAWKGAKWISRVQFLEHDQPGFWEKNGYSNTAHPWRDDRYSSADGQSGGLTLRMSSLLLPLLTWLTGTLAVSCLLLLLAHRLHSPDLARAVMIVSCLAAFGAIPYAVRKGIQKSMAG